MSSPFEINSLIFSSICLLDNFSGSKTLSITRGFNFAFFGYRHSCVIPYSLSWQPSSKISSVALGKNDTILSIDILLQQFSFTSFVLF